MAEEEPKEEFDDMIEENGILMCREHRRELCHMCCTDHRPSNAITRKEQKLGRALTDAEMNAVLAKTYAEADQEQRDIMRERQERGRKGPLMWGGEETQELYDAIARGCATCGKTGVELLACGRCKNVKYCNRKCQVKGWKKHKKVCTPASTERIRVPSAAYPTLAAAVAKAKPNSVVEVKGLQQGAVTVTQPLKIQGSERPRVEVTGLVTVSAKGKVVLSGLKMSKGLKITGNEARVAVNNCHITNPAGAAAVIKAGGALTMTDSRIFECRNHGVFNERGKLTLIRCSIVDCGSDGVLSNPKITLADCTVQRIGKFPVKSQGGVEEIGTNDIQKAPGNNFPPGMRPK